MCAANLWCEGEKGKSGRSHLPSGHLGCHPDSRLGRCTLERSSRVARRWPASGAWRPLWWWTGRPGCRCWGSLWGGGRLLHPAECSRGWWSFPLPPPPHPVGQEGRGVAEPWGPWCGPMVVKATGPLLLSFLINFPTLFFSLSQALSSLYFHLSLLSPLLPLPLHCLYSLFRCHLFSMFWPENLHKIPKQIHELSFFFIVAVFIMCLWEFNVLISKIFLRPKVLFYFNAIIA